GIVAAGRFSDVEQPASTASEPIGFAAEVLQERIERFPVADNGQTEAAPREAHIQQRAPFFVFHPACLEPEDIDRRKVQPLGGMDRADLYGLVVETDSLTA